MLSIEDYMRNIAACKIDVDLARAYAAPNIQDDTNTCHQTLASTVEVSKFFDAFGSIVGTVFAEDSRFIFPNASSCFYTILSLLRQSCSILYIQNPTFRRWHSISDILNYSTQNFNLNDSRPIDSGEHCVIVLTCPNPPFGDLIYEKDIETLASQLNPNHCTVVLDMTGRFFSSEKILNVYEAMKNTGIRTFIIEDTGKIFFASGHKLSTVTELNKRDQSFSKLAFFLNRPPTKPQLNNVVDEIANYAETPHHFYSIKRVSKNRRYLQSIEPLKKFVHHVPNCSSDILLLKENQCELEVAANLLEEGVATVPLGFFWNSQTDNRPRGVRVSLTQPSSLFEIGVKKITSKLGH